MGSTYYTGGNTYTPEDGSPSIARRVMHLMNQPVDLVAHGAFGDESDSDDDESVIEDALSDLEDDDDEGADDLAVPHTYPDREGAGAEPAELIAAITSGTDPAAKRGGRPMKIGFRLANLRKVRKDDYILDYAVRAWLEQEMHVAETPHGLKGHYRMEALDPRHRMADLLRTVFAHWRAMCPSMPFLAFCNSLKPGEVAQMFAHHPPYKQYRLVLAFYRGVDYMSKSERKSYRLTVKGGTLRYQGAPFDTSSMSTVFSGPGVAIFVMDRKERFYAASHILGQLHHSSFLAGAEVAAGGELMARAGRLVMISGKSGHYKPDMNALLNCVRTLEKQGLPVRAAKVRLYRKGPDGHPLRDADGTRRDPVTGAVVEKDKSMPVYVSGWEFLTGKPHEKYCAWGH